MSGCAKTALPYDHASKRVPSIQSSNLQFVMVQEPYKPPNDTHRSAVRSHVMRSIHARRRQRNSLPTKEYRLRARSTNLLPSPETCDKIRRGNPLSQLSSGEPRSNLPKSQTRDTFDRWLFFAAAPFSLLQVDGAPALLMNARTWPFPQPAGTGNPAQSVWMPGRVIPRPNRYSSRACLHRRLEVLPHIHNSPEYFIFKVATIKWLNNRLSNHIDSTSDATIGSILLLASFEIGRGNFVESRYHLDGLQRILSLRGGLENISDDNNLVVKVLLIDLLVSILNNTMPRFQRLHNHQRSRWNRPNVLGRSAGTDLVSQSPLLGVIRLTPLLDNSDFGPESVIILQRMQDLTTSKLQLEIEPHSPRPRVGSPSHISALGRNILHTIQLAATIYTRALSNPPIAFSSTLNGDLASQLCHALEDATSDQTWDKYPGVHLWILLTAAAATEGTSPETCLVGHGMIISLIAKVSMGAGYGWWNDMYAATTNFGVIKKVMCDSSASSPDSLLLF